jgi:hypothetical protein
LKSRHVQSWHNWTRGAGVDLKGAKKPSKTQLAASGIEGQHKTAAGQHNYSAGWCTAWRSGAPVDAVVPVNDESHMVLIELARVRVTEEQSVAPGLVPASSTAAVQPPLDTTVATAGKQAAATTKH